MFDKDDLGFINMCINEYRKILIRELNKLYDKTKGRESLLSDEDLKYKKYLNEYNQKCNELEKIIITEIQNDNYFKLLKRAFKKMLLKKCIKWLSD